GGSPAGARASAGAAADGAAGCRRGGLRALLCGRHPLAGRRLLLRLRALRRPARGRAFAFEPRQPALEPFDLLAQVLELVSSREPDLSKRAPRSRVDLALRRHGLAERFGDAGILAELVHEPVHGFLTLSRQPPDEASVVRFLSTSRHVRSSSVSEGPYPLRREPSRLRQAPAQRARDENS